MTITSKHAEYSANIDAWIKVDDVCKGQPIICMPEITHEQYTIVKEEGLSVGSRKGSPAKVDVVQAKENNLVKQLMTDKWAKMKEMGARLVEVGSANKTATQADNEDSVQHLVLSLAVSNISEAFQMALRWCAKYAFPNHDLKPDELTYVISQDFNKQKYDAVRSKLIYEACLAVIQTTADITLPFLGEIPATNAGIIAGQTIAGMAHNGIDNIPKEGTWLLDGGERVLNPQQNKDLTNYLSSGKSDGGEVVQVNQTITFSDGSATVSTSGQKELAQGFQNMMETFTRKEMRQGDSIYNFVLGRY